LRVSLHVVARRAPGHLHLVVILLADKMQHLARYRAHAADVQSQRTAVIGQNNQAFVELPVGHNLRLGALIGRCRRHRRLRRAGRLYRRVGGTSPAT